MKPAFESVGTSGNSSFVVRKFVEKTFSAPYHFHPELELTLILNGSGKRYVGTHMQDYFPGDLVLLGANVPHCWKTGDLATGDSVSIVVHFTADFLGKDFFQAPEMKLIRQLLNNSSSGLQFPGATSAVGEKIIGLTDETNNYRKLMTLLAVLYTLATTERCVKLHPQTSFPALSHAEKERINAVMAYIVDNFQDTISLEQAASRAGMTSHAFCKYFKRITRKTFVEAVNDYRIDFAVRQLVQTDKPVAQIGFDSGFNDISNFYKMFRDRLKVSPLHYRNSFMKS